MAGAEGIEPPTLVLETSIIPLNHAPIACCRASPIASSLNKPGRKRESTDSLRSDQTLN